MKNNNNKEIFKELKSRFKYLESLGLDVLFIALQGSQNYGLDIYTDEYKSDFDCMAVVLPSLEDIINSKPEVSTTIILDNNEHVVVKDVRQMFKLFQKQNVQFIELLFTEYKIINKKYKDVVRPLFQHRDRIASINKKSMYNNIFGIAMQKYKSFDAQYPDTEKDINNHGYSGKALYHIIRLSYFIEKLNDNVSFNKAMYVKNDTTILNNCIKAKLCKYDLDEARFELDRYYNKIDNTEQDSIDNVVLLENIKSDILKQRFIEQLSPNIEKEYKLCPDTYSKVWVTSDNHFGHANIMLYEDRIARLRTTSLEQHDNELIKRWNSKVGKNDLVLILGDFSFRDAKGTMELLNQLNGDKVLIRGNHDIYLNDKRFNKSLFKAIYDYKEIKYKGQEIVLMHYPILDFKHQSRVNNPAVLLFGHIHSNKMMMPKHSFNVGVDVNNYYPVDLEIAIKRALVNICGLMNKCD